jgi:hypothetical protein
VAELDCVTVVDVARVNALSVDKIALELELFDDVGQVR